MKKIKILAIPSDKHGVGKYRILDPYKYIGDNFSNDIHVDITYNTQNNDEYFRNYDIVVFHSFIHQLSHEDNVNRIKWLKKEGIIVVMDIDDYWLPSSNHPMYQHIVKNKWAEKKIELLKLADYVTTTTPIFANTIFNKLKIKNVFVFPNAVNEKEQQFQPEPIESSKIRFLWSGGSSHLQDIELLSEGISTIYGTYQDKVQFVLCGFDTRGEITEINKETNEQRRRPIKPMETVWFKYENIFTKNYKVIDEDYRKFLLSFENKPYNDFDKPYRRCWTEDINKYAKNYNNGDIILIPLVDNEFNTNKSQLKIIEAGFHKKAVIISEVEPYTLDIINAVDEGVFNKNGNALFVNPKKNHKDWAKQMKRLIDNPEMIKELGERLYETVKYKYSLKTTCEDRVNFFKTIINK